MLNRFGKYAPVLLAASLLAGCAGIKEQVSTGFGLFGGDPGPKPAALVAFTPSAAAKTMWQARVGKGAGSVFTPAVVKDAVYAAGGDGSVARFDATSGKQVWRIDAGGKLSGGVGSDGHLVLVGSPKGEVLAFDAANGQALWRAQVTSEVLSAPQAAEGIVVVRTGDGRIFGLDARDGKRKWVYQRITPALTLRNYAGVLVTRGAVFAGFAGGKLVALNLANGQVGWEATVALPHGATELERIADITSVPVADDLQVCAVAYQGRVACFDPRNGNPIWAREMSSVAGLAIDPYGLYVTDVRGAVHALDKRSGASLWKQDKLFARQVTAPLALGRFLVVGDLEGYVHFLSRDDGSFAARIATDGSAIVAQPGDLIDGALVQTRNGGVFALTIN